MYNWFVDKLKEWVFFVNCIFIILFCKFVIFCLVIVVNSIVWKLFDDK